MIISNATSFYLRQIMMLRRGQRIKKIGLQNSDLSIDFREPIHFYSYRFVDDTDNARCKRVLR